MVRSAAATPFVDRDNEMQLIVKALAGARSNPATQWITIVGEPGIGKSRLVAEAIGKSDLLPLWGRCPAYGKGITYRPIAQILRAAGDIREDDDERRMYRKLARATRGAVDDLVLTPLVSILTGTRTYPVEETARAFRTFVEAIAVLQPLALVIEDVHWAESTLQDLIGYLANSALGVSMVCTRRPEVAEVPSEWIRISNVIELQPLARDDASQLISQLAGAGLRGALLERILDASGGNPFFVEQIVLMLDEQALLPPADGSGRPPAAPDAIALPPTVAAVLDARLDLLPNHVRRVAEQAAIMGKVFYPRAVAALAEPDEEVDRSIADLVARGFVAACATDIPGEEAFGFRHILIRDAVSRGTLKRRRAEWHERIGEWLDVRAEALGDREELVGYHLEQAHRLSTELGLRDERLHGLAARASALLGVAGRRAFDRGDAPAAADLLARALSLASDDPTRVRLMTDLAAAQLDSGRVTAAVSTARAAVEAARSGAPRLALRARVVGILVNLHADIVDLASLISESEGILYELQSWGDPEATVDAMTTIGILEYSIGRMSASVERLRKAATGAREISDPAREDRALDWLSLPVAYGPTPVAEALEVCDGIIRATRPRSRVEASARASMAVLQAMSGQIHAARANIDLSRVIYEELGMLEAAAVSQALARVESMSGDPQLAEAQLRRDRNVLEERGNVAYLISTELRLALLLDELGRRNEAQRLAERLESLVPADDVVARAQLASIRVHALLSERRYAEAEEAAKDSVVAGRTTDRFDVLPNALSDLADVYWATGRRHDALGVLREVRSLHSAKGNEASLAVVDQKIARLGENHQAGQ
jgi:tetratricopeptide (TPR) repeat protein